MVDKIVKEGKKYKVIGFSCGRGACFRFTRMGILEGCILKIVSIHPMEGPIVVRHNENEIAIGYGMFDKLRLEEINE